MNLKTGSVNPAFGDELLARKNIYQFFRLLLAKPIELQTVAMIREHTNLSVLKDFHEGARILYEFFQYPEVVNFQKEKEEYEQLFVGPGSILAPMWGACYCNNEHLLFDETTYEIRKLYHKSGLKFYKENNEPDDHLLALFEFMVFLIDKTITECEKQLHESQGIITQITLLEDHLLKWVPLFCDRVLNSTKSSLYLGLAFLLRDFMEMEKGFLIEAKERMTYVQ